MGPLMRPHQVENYTCGLDWFFCYLIQPENVRHLFFPWWTPWPWMEQGTFLSSTVSLKPKLSQELNIKSTAINSTFFFKYSVKPLEFPKRLSEPSFSGLRMHPLAHHAIRSNALSKQILEIGTLIMFSFCEKPDLPPSFFYIPFPFPSPTLCSTASKSWQHICTKQ